MDDDMNTEKFEVKRSLTDLPGLPSETTEASDFIGANVDEVMADDSLSKEERQDAIRGTKSSNGEAYDPALHSYPPSETQKGAWKKRRMTKGRKEAEVASNAEYRKAAENAATLYATLNHVALGEGAEIDKTALPLAVDAFEQYYIQRGVQELPLWASMVVGLGSYTYTVASKPKPKKRVKGWWNTLLVKVGMREPSKDEQVAKREPSGSGFFGE